MMVGFEKLMQGGSKGCKQVRTIKNTKSSANKRLQLRNLALEAMTDQWPCACFPQNLLEPRIQVQKITLKEDSYNCYHKKNHLRKSFSSNEREHWHMFF